MSNPGYGCDILFGQSYFLRFDPKLFEAMQPFPPLGTLYAASYLRELGYQVALFDAMLAESEADWQQALEYHHPHYAILFEDNFNYLSKMCLLRMRQAAYTMIQTARQRGCTVISCGADATDHPAMYLEHGADYVVLGEGEATLAELLALLEGVGEQGLDQILGLAWMDPKGQGLKMTPHRPDLRDLDALPFPAWDLVDVPRYREIWIEQHGIYAMNMATTRGCPFHCNWCAKPIWGQRYNSRSPENVAAEMRWLCENYSPDYIWFVDDIFGLKPGWIDRLADRIESEGVKIPFKCLSRVDLLLREGEVGALKKAGADIVWVGAESGSQKILDAMDKGTKVEQIKLASKRLRQIGIKVGFFLQFGYPGETREDIELTLRMVRVCLPDDIGMSVSYPLPGTGFHAAVKEQLGEKQNWYDSDDLAMLYQGPFSTAFYRQLHITLHREFRMLKAWRMVVSPVIGMQGSKGNQRDPGRMRILGKCLYYAIRLPFDRWKLNRLAQAPHTGISILPRMLTPEEAAKPTPQAE
jgi:anaerobic magnesium-protoporphyrin IX monomethyl ester cyclase